MRRSPGCAAPGSALRPPPYPRQPWAPSTPHCADPAPTRAVSNAVAHRLEALAADHGLDEVARRRLDRLLDLLERREAPTAVHERRRAIDLHLADSLAGLRAPGAHGRAADRRPRARARACRACRSRSHSPPPASRWWRAPVASVAFLRQAVEVLELGNVEVDLCARGGVEGGIRGLRRGVCEGAWRRCRSCASTRRRCCPTRACSSRGRATSTMWRPRTAARRPRAWDSSGCASRPSPRVPGRSAGRCTSTARSLRPRRSSPVGQESRQNGRCLQGLDRSGGSVGSLRRGSR